MRADAIAIDRGPRVQAVFFVATASDGGIGHPVFRQIIFGPGHGIGALQFGPGPALCVIDTARWRIGYAVTGQVNGWPCVVIANVLVAQIQRRAQSLATIIQSEREHRGACIGIFGRHLAIAMRGVYPNPELARIAPASTNVHAATHLPPAGIVHVQTG